MQGLMQPTPLTLPHFFNRAERLFPGKELVTATAKGRERTTYGAWADRTRRLGGMLDDLGISGDGRVGSFAWNTARHLELYYAAPCTGRVLHTLNIRLFPEQLTYIVNHAEDEVVFVDRSLLPVLWPHVPTFTTVKHFVVMDDGADAEIPDDPRISDYETLLGDAKPVDFHVDDENQAGSMMYTSGTTGNPKGVVYSHRSMYLHTMGVMMADSLGVRESDVILPVVPMFHANAWGLAHAAVGAGASLVMPGADLSGPAIADLIESEKVTVAAACRPSGCRCSRCSRAATSPASAPFRAVGPPCRRRCPRASAGSPACRCCRRGA
jgi:fatty-acyl-CoA synthase